MTTDTQTPKQPCEYRAFQIFQSVAGLESFGKYCVWQLYSLNLTTNVLHLAGIQHYSKEILPGRSDNRKLVVCMNLDGLDGFLLESI